MNKKVIDFIELSKEIKRYTNEESFKFDEKYNLLKYHNFLINFINQYKDINLNELDNLTREKIVKIFNDTRILIQKKNLFFIHNNKNSFCISKYCEFLPYIKRFEINLKKISKLLESVQNNINICEDWLNKFQNNPNSLENAYNVELISYILSAAIQLRFCIEIIVSQSIFNNINKLKNNYKGHLKDNFSEMLSYLNENRIDYVVKTLIPTENEAKDEFKYYKNQFWSNISSWYQDLNSIVHYQPKNDSNLSDENIFLKNKKTYSSYVEKEMTFLNFAKIKDIYKYLYESLENHIVSFENDECYVVVKNFKINYNNFSETFVFKNQDNIVRFIEIINK